MSEIVVSPAPAGMIPALPHLEYTARCEPRTRGDDPLRFSPVCSRRL